MQVDVVEQERYWYPDDGGEVWVAGYQLVDAEGRYLGRDAPELVDAGLRVSRVAGARDHHAEALQSEAVAPGSALVLRRDRRTRTTRTRSQWRRRKATCSGSCRASSRRRSRRASTAASRSLLWCCASSGPRRATRGPALTMLLDRSRGST